MRVCAISAVTLFIENMERSCSFYSRIPGFKLVYGGSRNWFFYYIRSWYWSIKK